MEHIPVIGWAVIGFIATLIFIAIMRFTAKGVDLSVGDKKLSIGKINKRLDDNIEDEELRKTLFKRSIAIDEHLNADLRKTVRRLDGKIRSLLEPFFSSFLSVLIVEGIIKDELNERLDYNNIREKLSSAERADYLYEIVKDIGHAFSAFVLQLLKTQKEEKLPEWADLKPSIEQLISEWEKEVTTLLIRHIEEKASMYEAAQTQFKTKEYIKTSIIYPLEKNQKYLQELRG
ncbi:MAG: hypothetical protein ACTTI3_06940 [Treponema sp.]